MGHLHVGPFGTRSPRGLPQGFRPRPLLFIIYTSDLSTLLAFQAMLAQLYADDVQGNPGLPARPTLPRLKRCCGALGTGCRQIASALSP